MKHIIVFIYICQPKMFNVLNAFFFILIHKSHHTTYLPDRRYLIRIPKLIRNRNKHLFIFYFGTHFQRAVINQL